MVFRALAAVLLVVVPSLDARAECGDVVLANVELSDGAISFCRVQRADNTVVDCLRLDLDGGAYKAIAAPADVKPLPNELKPPVTAEKAAGGVKVCKPDVSACTVVAIPDLDKFDRFASNEARTILAARSTDEDNPLVETFDVATGKHLASVKAPGDVIEVLGETLYVLSPCAGPCTGVLWNARTGKKIGAVSHDIAGANSAEIINVGADVWVFKEDGRVRGEDGVLFEDVKTGKIVRRIGGSKLARTIKGHEVPYFRLLPARHGVLVLFGQSLPPATLGDAALIDRSGSVRRFDAPACN